MGPKGALKKARVMHVSTSPRPQVQRPSVSDVPDLITRTDWKSLRSWCTRTWINTVIIIRKTIQRLHIQTIFNLRLNVTVKGYLVLLKYTVFHNLIQTIAVCAQLNSLKKMNSPPKNPLSFSLIIIEVKMKFPNSSFTWFYQDKRNNGI